MLNGIDYTNMRFTRLNAESDSLTIIDKYFECELHNVSGVEQSGVVVDNLSSSRLVIDEGLIEFTSSRLLTSGAVVNLPYLRLKAPSWSAYDHFVDSVEMNISSRSSRLNLSALRNFVSGIDSYDVNLERFTATYDGVPNNFALNVSSAVIDSNTFVLIANVSDISEPQKALFDVRCAQFADHFCSVLPHLRAKLLLPILLPGRPSGTIGLLVPPGFLRFSVIWCCHRCGRIDLEGDGACQRRLAFEADCGSGVRLARF